MDIYKANIYVFDIFNKILVLKKTNPPTPQLEGKILFNGSSQRDPTTKSFLLPKPHILDSNGAW